MTAVLRILLANPKEGELIEALGAWQDPSVADALWEAFRHDPGNSVLALAVARQGIHQAAPLIRHIYFSSLLDRPEKIDAAAALVSLDGSKASLMLKYLIETMTIGPQVSATSDRYDLRQQAVCVVGQMDIKAAIPTLQSLIRHYLDSKHPHGSQADTDAGYEEVLVVYAVLSLSQMHDTSSKELVSELLEYFHKNDAGEVEDVSEAALDLGIPETTLRKYLNSDDDMAHIQSLRYQEKTLRPTDR